MPKNKQVFIDIGQGLAIMMGLLTIPSWDNSNRPRNARVGTFGFNFQTDNLEYWNGRYWLAASMDKA